MAFSTRIEGSSAPIASRSVADAAAAGALAALARTNVSAIGQALEAAHS
jgi:hypothetical protein